jgi:hypothetical protein
MNVAVNIVFTATSNCVPLTSNYAPCLLAAVVLVKVLSLYDLRLMVAAPVSEIFVLLRELSGQCLYGRGGWGNHNLLLFLASVTTTLKLFFNDV